MEDGNILELYSPYAAPCRCGGRARVTPFGVECEKCGFTLNVLSNVSRETTKDDAIRRWNKFVRDIDALCGKGERE